MTQKIFSSLTASLLIATLGVSTSSNASPVESSKQGSSADLKQVNLKASLSETAAEPVPASNKSLSIVPQSREVVKVGEQVTKPEFDTTKEVIAKVQPHELSGQKAATLYVRNIPVLTFKGSIKASQDDIKLGTQLRKPFSKPSLAAQSSNPTKAQSSSDVHSLLTSSESLSELDSSELNLSIVDNGSSDDPVWRAAAIAARLNRLHRNGIDADKITVAWGDKSLLPPPDAIATSFKQT